MNKDKSELLENFLFAVNQPVVNDICYRIDEVLTEIMSEGQLSLQEAKKIAQEIIEHKPEKNNEV